MSLNELVLTDYKPWLNVRANNVIIDGDLSVRNSLENYALGYGADGNISFTPQLDLISVDIDAFGIVPVLNAGTGILDFELGPIPENNFLIDLNQNLKCINAGIYMLTLKYVEAQNTRSGVDNRPNPYLSINGLDQFSLSLRVPFCSVPFSSYSGMEMTSIFSLIVDDELTLKLAVELGGVTSMMNETFASNLILIKIA